MTDADHYTKPELYAERAASKRVRKRMESERRQFGNCCICRFRETTFGIPHCRGREDRRMGICEEDGQLPRFKFDDETLGRFRDAG